MLFWEYLHSKYPDAEALAELSPWGLAMVILQYWRSDAVSGSRALNQLPIPIHGSLDPYPPKDWHKVRGLVAVAKKRLMDEEFIVPGLNEDKVRLTDKGCNAPLGELAQPLPQCVRSLRELLHPSIEQKAWQHLREGRYDDAVLAAFKQLEVGVRQAGGFGESDYGVRLMQRAFNPKSGVLHDPNAGVPAGEEAALVNLYAGAIGLLKNPQSHRWVGINSPEDAGHALALASFLYRLLDTRLAALGKPPAQ